MSGHSKWATTKHRKAAQDKKRSALFSKLSRIVYVAAKAGGPDPANNAHSRRRSRRRAPTASPRIRSTLP